MMLSNMEHIIASALPYQETGDAQDKALAATVLGGGILAKYVTGMYHVTCCNIFNALAFIIHCTMHSGQIGAVKQLNSQLMGDFV